MSKMKNFSDYLKSRKGHYQDEDLQQAAEPEIDQTRTPEYQGAQHGRSSGRHDGIRSAEQNLESVRNGEMATLGLASDEWQKQMNNNWDHLHIENYSRDPDFKKAFEEGYQQSFNEAANEMIKKGGNAAIQQREANFRASLRDPMDYEASKNEAAYDNDEDMELGHGMD